MPVDGSVHSSATGARHKSHIRGGGRFLVVVGHSAQCYRRHRFKLVYAGIGDLRIYPGTPERPVGRQDDRMKRAPPKRGSSYRRLEVWPMRDHTRILHVPRSILNPRKQQINKNVLRPDLGATLSRDVGTGPEMWGLYYATHTSRGRHQANGGNRLGSSGASGRGTGEAPSIGEPAPDHAPASVSDCSHRQIFAGPAILPAIPRGRKREAAN
jgi:hypothetical protein